MAANVLCPECGFMHPPVARGTCPMAKSETHQKEVVSEYGQSSVDLSNSIQKAFLRKIQDYNNTDRHKTMCAQVIAYINSLK